MVALNEQERSIIADIKSRLAEAFGERLTGLVLYGSRARGDAQPDSDMDILVLLRGPVRLGPDIHQIVQTIYPVQLDADFSIHATPADEADYAAQNFALYRHAKAEGVPA